MFIVRPKLCWDAREFQDQQTPISKHQKLFTNVAASHKILGIYYLHLLLVVITYLIKALGRHSIWVIVTAVRMERIHKLVLPLISPLQYIAYKRLSLVSCTIYTSRKCISHLPVENIRIWFLRKIIHGAVILFREMKPWLLGFHSYVYFWILWICIFPATQSNRNV